ncbi:lipoprotein signal peptidase [Millionella massiliensis]|mgnify:CR=1 FL=1|uniref:lipoprotein signal peptidase n=1 Tax=Millionella massiliensis TaxID=1871023 RepID=UPI0024B8099B|nr:lipoprotein signal peptidase [Millionella massiliensis]
MESNRKKSLFVVLLVIGLLILDQIVKICVKTHMTLDEAIPVFGEWFYIRFIENRGAAYGMELGGDFGKLFLSLFRIVAVVAIGWYIRRLIRHQAPVGVIVGVSVVLAGALGNIVDSAFYGLIFSESTFTEVARFVPWGEGYASFLHGSVVDMLYFPIIEIEQMPDWVPIWGGEPFTFFSPIFNIADSYVTCGMVYLLLFQYKFFK